MGRLSRSPYQKAKLVSGDESLFRLRDHSEWGRRRSHEFYEYITSTSEYVGWRVIRNPRVPLVTARPLKDGKGARPGGNWKVLLKIALVARSACIRGKTRDINRPFTGEQRKLTNVHLLTSFRLDLRCALDFCLSICFQMFRCRNCFSKLRKYFAFEQFNM